MKMVDFYAKLLPDIESAGLLEKSAYDLHFDGINKKVLYGTELTGNALRFLAANYKQKQKKYVSIEARSVADLRFIAGAIS
jgi:hypothetical protein